MSDALSFVEIDGQHVELLPSRTVLSLFSAAGRGGNGGLGAPGGVGRGGLGANLINANVLGDQTNLAGSGVGGDRRILGGGRQGFAAVAAKCRAFARELQGLAAVRTDEFHAALRSQRPQTITAWPILTGHRSPCNRRPRWPSGM